MEIDTSTTFYQEVLQLEVGHLEIEARVYKGEIGVQVDYHIEVKSLLKGDQTGWGSTVFTGTLKELIQALEKGKGDSNGRT